MAKPGKCPYCSGGGKKVSGKVASQPTNLAYGYGERVYRCSQCGEEYRAFYSIPPKGTRGGMVKPHEKIMKVGFTEGVRGFASPVVLKASIPVPEKSEPEEKPEIDGVGGVPDE